MESEFKEKNTEQMLLQDLNLVVGKSEYSCFLRDFFHLDSRQLMKRLQMFLMTYPDRFVVDAEKESVRFITPKELSDLKYTVKDRTCDFLLLWCVHFPIRRSDRVLFEATSLIRSLRPAFPCSRIF